LLGTFRFRIVDESLHNGRACWHVVTQAVESQRPPFLPMLFGTQDFELWVDQEVGIIVRSEARLDGELSSFFVIDELTVDEPVDPEVFAFVTPDGSPVRTQGEMQLEHLRQRGVDVTGIDRSDPEQVQVAMQANFAVFSQPPDMDQLAAVHTPTGPPPDDEESARIDIGVAFQAMGKASDDGATLPNVEGGDNLGPCAAEIRRRYPQFTNGSSLIRIERIKFLHQSEAVVWFANPQLPMREGRAVLVDGTWKVSRATYCSIIAMGGVTCPPPTGPS
jgi:hypothetical protein